LCVITQIVALENPNPSHKGETATGVPCNVPILGHHYIIEGYDDQSSQIEVIASTKIIERYFGVRLASLIPFHHYEPFRTGWLWFHCIPTISMILSILSYKLIKFTEEIILGTKLGGTSQCNSSLESGGT
jgi:hypothetical protein